jgi:hypothetical protein
LCTENHGGAEWTGSNGHHKKRARVWKRIVTRVLLNIISWRIQRSWTVGGLVPAAIPETISSPMPVAPHESIRDSLLRATGPKRLDHEIAPVDIHCGTGDV